MPPPLSSSPSPGGCTVLPPSSPGSGSFWADPQPLALHAHLHLSGISSLLTHLLGSTTPQVALRFLGGQMQRDEKNHKECNGSPLSQELGLEHHKVSMDVPGKKEIPPHPSQHSPATLALEIPLAPFPLPQRKCSLLFHKENCYPTSP